MRPEPTGERAFVAHLERILPSPPVGQVWIGDDAAVLDDGRLAAVDTLVAGVHFDLRWCEAEDVGWKALAVNLSDVAAMGGEPVACLLSISVPDAPEGLARRVVDGVAAAAAEYGCPVVGGDTTGGPVLTVSVTVLGRVGAGAPVLRSGARAGDLVFVTGALGGARRALTELRRGNDPGRLAGRLHRPRPRLAEGAAAAASGAVAMIDLSDGLALDVSRLCEASGVGVRLDLASLPLDEGVAPDDALEGGDDYELVFVAPDERRVAEAFARRVLDAPTVVGAVVDGPATVVDEAGRESPLEPRGWEHRVP